MTLPDSGAIFVQAFPRECTETFLEGHRRAFEFLEGSGEGEGVAGNVHSAQISRIFSRPRDR